MLSNDELRAELARRFEAGPVDLEALFGDLRVEFDTDEGEFVIDMIGYEFDPVELSDGRLASRDTLTAGVGARHRPTAAERAGGWVNIEDFMPVLLAPGDPTRVDWRGTELLAAEPDPSRSPSFHLDLPQDCWDMLGDDVELLVRRQDDRFVLEPMPASDAEQGTLPALADWLLELGRRRGRPLDSGSGDDEGADIEADSWVLSDELMSFDLLADHGDLLRAGVCPPLSEIIEAAGCTWESPWVVGPGASPREFATYALGRAVIDTHGRPEHDDVAEVVGLALLLYAAWASDPTHEGRRAKTELAPDVLGQIPEVCEVLVGFQGREADEDSFDTFVLDTYDHLRTEGLDIPPGVAWLTAERLVEQDRAVEGLALLVEVERALDPEEWAEALDFLAHLLVIQGDLAGATARYQRLGEQVMVDELARFRPVGPKGVGRNDPCPCGSGRKFKQCCANRPVAEALADRVGLLWWKAEEYCGRTHSACISDSLRVAFELDDAVVGRAMVGLALDGHLVEDGAFEEFLETEGVLLPDDERALAHSWLDRTRSLFALAEAADDGLAVVDLVAGEQVLVAADSAPPDLVKGDLLMARAVATGGAIDRFVGAVTVVPVDQVDECLALLAAEPSSDDLVDFVLQMAEEVAGFDFGQLPDEDR
jgi:uncharacterized protein YchJ